MFAYSGITDARIEPIAKSQTTVTSIRTAVAHKQRTGVVLYWRPIVPGWNDQADTISGVLDVGRDVDAIVFTGYYHKQENADFLRGLDVEVPYGDDYARRKTMPLDLDARLVAAWRDSGIATPLFRKTSCGVAYAHGNPDYNGHWGVCELCDICPAKQRRLCADDYREPTATDIDAVLAQFGYDTHYVVEPGHVWTHGLLMVIVLLWTTARIPGLVGRYVTQNGRGPNFLGTVIRVVVVRQLTRRIPGLGRAARAVTR